MKRIFIHTTAVIALSLYVLSPTALAQDPPAFSRTHLVPIDSTVIRPADIPDQNWNSGHRGVDFEAPPGSHVRASRGGVVHFAGMVAGTPVVSVEHNDGLRTTYEPVHATVAKGDFVRRGQVIGTLVNPSTLGEHARRTHGLSWGAKIGQDSYIDPMTLLGTPHIVLKQ